MKKKVSLNIIPYILILILAGFVAFSYVRDINAKWQCNIVNCTELMTADEWVAENCGQTVNGTMCKVTFQGQQILVPIDQLNLDNLRECKKFACVQETRVRDVNYEIKANQ